MREAKRRLARGMYSSLAAKRLDAFLRNMLAKALHIDPTTWIVESALDAEDDEWDGSFETGFSSKRKGFWSPSKREIVEGTLTNARLCIEGKYPDVMKLEEAQKMMGLPKSERDAAAWLYYCKRAGQGDDTLSKRYAAEATRIESEGSLAVTIAPGSNSRISKPHLAL